MYEADARTWAEETFGHAELGDPRRVDRLVDYATRQALHPSASRQLARAAIRLRPWGPIDS